jgi:hypothetical protein
MREVKKCSNCHLDRAWFCEIEGHSDVCTFCCYKYHPEYKNPMEAIGEE